MMPALRRKTLREQAGEIVAIQLLQVIRVDVVARVRVKVPIRRGHHQQPVRREHARELDEHRKLVRRRQVLDGLEGHHHIDRCRGERQARARGGDETHPLAVPVRRARAIDRRHVDVDAEHVRGNRSQQARAIAFSAGRVEHTLARDEAARKGVTVPVLVGNLTGIARQKALAREFRGGSQRGGN